MGKIVLAIEVFNRIRRIVKRNLVACLCLPAALCLTGCAGSPNLSGGGVDFSLSVSPGSQAVTAGEGINFLVTVNQASALGPIVQLSVSGLPAGVIARFMNGSLTAGGTVSLSIITGPTTPPGASQLTITGSDPSGTQKTTVMLMVTSPPPPPDFNLTATPGTQATLAGGSVSYRVNVTANGNPTVNLSVNDLPSGVTAGFDNSTVAGTGAATLTVSTTAATAANSYGLTITGADPSGAENIQVRLVVAAMDFSLASDIGSAVITAGGILMGTVTVMPAVGSPGTVNLSLVGGAPPGITVSLSPSEVAGGNGASTLTIATSASLAPGDYQVSIEGADSTGSQTVTILLAVAAGNPNAGFSISVSPPDEAVNAGDTAIYTLQVLSNGGPVPPVSVGVQGLPDGAASQIAQNGPDTFTINILTDPQGTSSTSQITITVTGPGGSQSLTVMLEVNQNN